MSSKVRESLENIVHHFCTNCPNDGQDGCELSEVECRFEFLCQKLKQARAALAEPLRNCDVGSVDEQEERFHAFCNRHTVVDAQHCNGCPINNMPAEADCLLVWEQLPYDETEGGAE